MNTNGRRLIWISRQAQWKMRRLWTRTGARWGPRAPLPPTTNRTKRPNKKIVTPYLEFCILSSTNGPGLNWKGPSGKWTGQSYKWVFIVCPLIDLIWSIFTSLVVKRKHSQTLLIRLDFLNEFFYFWNHTVNLL